MTDLVYEADRIGDAQALLTHQLQGSADLNALIAALARQSQDLEDAAAQLRLRLDIDSQVGAQLDAIGALVNQPRQGRQDPVYRLWLKARIRANRSSGLASDIYAIAFLLLGADADLHLAQIPVGHVLYVAGEFPAPDVVSVQQILQDASATAVPFYLQYALAAYDRLTTVAGATPVPSSALGFDNARLVDWMGPDREPDRYALIAATFGRRLRACWDCRAAIYNEAGELQRIPGHASELAPLPINLEPPTRGAEDARGIAPVLLHSQSVLSTRQHVELFDGTATWAVGMRITTGSDADQIVFEVSADPAVESGTDARVIRIVVGTASTQLQIRVGAFVPTFTFPGVTANTDVNLIVCWFGTSAIAYIDGVPSTDTAAAAPVPGLEFVTWGGYDSSDDAVTWSGHKLALFDRALTATEAAALHELLNREFTDNAYY